MDTDEHSQHTVYLCSSVCICGNSKLRLLMDNLGLIKSRNSENNRSGPDEND